MSSVFLESSLPSTGYPAVGLDILIRLPGIIVPINTRLPIMTLRLSRSDNGEFALISLYALAPWVAIETPQIPDSGHCPLSCLKHGNSVRCGKWFLNPLRRGLCRSLLIRHTSRFVAPIPVDTCHSPWGNRSPRLQTTRFPTSRDYVVLVRVGKALRRSA